MFQKFICYNITIELSFRTHCVLQIIIRNTVPPYATSFMQLDAEFFYSDRKYLEKHCGMCHGIPYYTDAMLLEENTVQHKGQYGGTWCACAICISPYLTIKHIIAI